MSIMSYVLFFGVFLLIYGGMNYYFYYNLVTSFSIFQKFWWFFGIVFFFLAASYLLARRMRGDVKSLWLSNIGSVWMGVLSLAVTVYLIKDLAAVFMPGHALRLKQWALGVLLLLAVYSVVNVMMGPRIKKVSIQHEKIGENPLSIVHLSDIHLNGGTSENWVRRIVSQVNELEPDLVVITGDLIDDHFAEVARFTPLLKEIKSSKGVYVVAGNHEHYHDIDNFKKFTEASGMLLLDNQWTELDGTINLIGIDDLVIARTKNLKETLDALADQSDMDKFNILLLHQPVGFPYAAERGIDLQLSGHTHQGQLPPLNLLVKLYYRYDYGLKKFNDSYIYTSAGTGTWGPPMRLFSHSEIVHIQIDPLSDSKK